MKNTELPPPIPSELMGANEVWSRTQEQIKLKQIKLEENFRYIELGFESLDSKLMTLNHYCEEFKETMDKYKELLCLK